MADERLHKINSKEPIRELSAISSYRPKSGHLLTLFDLLNKKELNRETALDYFNKNGKTREYFNVLYKKLKGKLLDGVIIYPFNDLAEYNSKSFEAYNRFIVALKLIRSDNKMTGIPEAKNVLKICIELGLINFGLILALELENHYAVVFPDTNKYFTYKKISDELYIEWDKEVKNQRLFYQLAHCIAKRKSPVHSAKIILSLREIERGKYYRSNLFYYSTKSLYYRVTQNKEKIIETCQEAAKFFSTFESPIPYTTTWNFYRQMIPILVGEGKYAEAEKVAKNCVNLCRKGAFNWHISLLHLALVGFHSNKPKIALQAYKDAYSGPLKFEKSKDIDGRWRLIRSYLELYDLPVPGKFRLYKFLNSVPTLNADKSRNNVAVIIVHMLHLWKDGKKEAFGDISKQLKGYVHRHLRKEGFERSRWFLSMLEKFYEAGFHPVRYQPRIKALWKKMTNSSAEVSVNVFETEVVPFEQLWEMIKNQR